ncbi:MAG: LPS assembly protein LptD [Desulfurobacteriaceae bacterium]
MVSIYLFSHQFFPNDQFYGSINSELINSRTYFISSQTFSPEEKTKAYTKSDITFSKLWKHAILNVNAVYLRSLDGSTATIYQRIPNIRLYLLDIPLGNTPFSFSNDLDFTYFYREAGGSGYRLNVEPALVFGKRWKRLKNSSRFSVLLTKYQHGGDRSIFQFKDTVTTHFFFPLTEKLSFSFNPRLEVLYREEEDQSSNPFYDTTDRIEGEKSLNTFLDSFVYYSGRRVARLSLKALYDFQNEEDHFGLWKFDLDFSPSKKMTFRETLFYSVKDSELNKANTYFSAKSKLLSLWLNHYYEFNKEVLNNYLRWGVSIPLGKYLSFSYSQRYDLLLSKDREREYAISVKRNCWNGRLSYRWVRNYDNTVDYQVLLVVNLLKVGNYGYRFIGKKE